VRLLLNTPLGEIAIRLNERKIPFNVAKLENTYLGQHGAPVFKVEGRYKVSVNITDVKTPLSLTCQVNLESTFQKSGIDSGERLALKTWENGTMMFSIGIEDEIDGINIEYLERGIEVCIGEKAKVEEIVFGIAWKHVEDYEKEYHHTWYAADPTYFGTL